MRHLTIAVLGLLVACGGADAPTDAPEPEPTADVADAGDAATKAAAIAKAVKGERGTRSLFSDVVF